MTLETFYRRLTKEAKTRTFFLHNDVMIRTGNQGHAFELRLCPIEAVARTEYGTAESAARRMKLPRKLTSMIMDAADYGSSQSRRQTTIRNRMLRITGLAQRLHSR